MIPIPGLGTPLPGEPPAIEIEVDGRDPGGQRNLLVGYPNCVFPADALLQVEPDTGLQTIRHRINWYEELADVVLRVNGTEIDDDDFQVVLVEETPVPIHEVRSTVEGRTGVNFVEVEYQHYEEIGDPTSQLRWSRFVCTFQFAESIRPFGDAPATRRANIEATLESDVFDETPWIADFGRAEGLDNVASILNRLFDSDAGVELLETAIEDSDRRIKRATLHDPRVAFGMMGTTLQLTLHADRVVLDIGKKNSSKRQMTARIDDVTYNFTASMDVYSGAPVLIIHSGDFVSRGSIDLDAQRAGAWFASALTGNNSERRQMEAHLHDAADDLRAYLQQMVIAPSFALTTARDEGSNAITSTLEIPSLGELIGGTVGSNLNGAELDLAIEVTRAAIARDEDQQGGAIRINLGALAVAEPVGELLPFAGSRIPGTPHIVDTSAYGRSGGAPVQAQLRWDLANELVYAYWATGALDGAVVSSERLGEVGALGALPSCVRFELATMAPPTFTGAGAGRVRAEFPGIRLTATVAPDALGECTAISEFLPLWVQLGVVAEIELATPGDAVLQLAAADVTELYVGADDWRNLMLALVLGGAADLGDLFTTELGPVDEGVNTLISEIVNALLGSLPLDTALPSIPLADFVEGSLGDVLGGASELAVTELSVRDAAGAYVDVETASRSRVVIDAALELR